MDDPLDPQLSAELDALKNVPERPMQAAARGRMQFLQEAASLAPALVQPAVKQKTSWNVFGFLPLFGKKPAGWAVRLALILAIAAAMLGTGGAAAVYAAQDSLPGETLYPVKTWGEDVLLTFASSPQTELNLNLEFAERRKSEIAALLYEDEELAAQSILRLQNHLQNAVRASELVNGEDALPSMLRLRDSLEYQQRLMEQLQENNHPAIEAEMNQPRQMIQEQMRIVENQLLEEEQKLRDQNQIQQQLQQPLQTGMPEQQGVEDQQNQLQGEGGQQRKGQGGQMQQTALPENPAIAATPTATLFPTGEAIQPGNGNYQSGKEAPPMPEEKQPGSGK